MFLNQRRQKVSEYFFIFNVLVLEVAKPDCQYTFDEIRTKLPAVPHRLEIQHCVKLETHVQANCLHFVRAPSSPTTLPYQFTLIEGGQFNPGNRYGIIDVTCESPCLVGIVADLKQQLQETTLAFGKLLILCMIPQLSFKHFAYREHLFA